MRLLANKATYERLAWMANFGNLSTDDRLKGNDKIKKQYIEKQN